MRTASGGCVIISNRSIHDSLVTQSSHGCDRHLPSARVLSSHEAMDMVATGMVGYVFCDTCRACTPSQYIVGLAFNWGIPVAWTAVTGRFPSPPIWILFSGGVWSVSPPPRGVGDTYHTVYHSTAGRLSMTPYTRARTARTTAG